FAWFEQGLNGSRNVYMKALGWLLKNRWFGWLVLLVCLLVNLALIPAGIIPRNMVTPLADELAPVEDRSFFFTIAIAPEGSTPDFVSRASRGKEAVYESMEEVRGYFV